MDGPITVHSPTSYLWSDLPVFLAVVAKGSLSKAGKALGVSQSTVTRRLNALESGLEVPLFERSADGVSLTDAGRELIPLAEQMQELANEIEERIRGFPPTVRGRVRVAMPEGIAHFLVIPMLGDLHAEHPDIELDILCGIEQVDLSRGEAELALRFTRPEHGPLTMRRVGTIEYRVFVPTRFFKRRRRKLNSGELNALEWVGWNRHYTTIPDAAWLQRVVPEANCVARLRSLLAIAHAVRAGLGAALLPTAIGRSLEGVMEVEVEAPTPRMPLWLVGHEEGRHVFRVKAVADFLADCCKGYS